MARPVAIPKLQTGNADLDRVQELVRQAVNPALASLPNAPDFRWMQLPGTDATVADTWVLQFRTTGTTWTTIATFNSSGQIVQSAWVAPTLLNGFTNFGGGFMGAGFYKDSIGIVRLRGLVQNVGGCAAATTIFTLPTGYLPSAEVRFTSAGEGAPTNFFLVDVNTSGSVFVVLAVAAGGFRALDGIAFDTRS